MIWLCVYAIAAAFAAGVTVGRRSTKLPTNVPARADRAWRRRRRELRASVHRMRGVRASVTESSR